MFGPVQDERLELRHEFEEYVANTLDHWTFLLPFGQGSGELGADTVDARRVDDVGEDGLYDSFPPLRRNRRHTVDLAPERINPEVPEILEVLDEVPFRVANFRDDFLSLLLSVTGAVCNFLGHAVDPQLLLVRLIHIIVVDGRPSLALEARPHLQVQPRHLLQPSRTSNRVAQLIPCAGGGIALGQQNEHAVDCRLLLNLLCHGFPKLVHLVGRITQSVLVCDIVEELLRIERAAQKQCQIPVGGPNDVGENVDRFGATESILVGEFVLGPVAHDDLLAEAFGNAGEKRRVDDWWPDLGSGRTFAVDRVAHRRSLNESLRVCLFARGDRGWYYRRGHRHGPVAVVANRRHHTRGPRLGSRRPIPSWVPGVWRCVATHVVGCGGAGTWRSPIGNHTAAHGLVRISVSVVRRITTHGHGPFLHMPLRHDPSLRSSSSRVLVAVGSLSEGIGGGLLLLIWLPWGRLLHLRSWIAR